MIGNQLHSRRRVLGRLDLPYSNLTHAYQFDGNSNDAIGSLHGTDINVIYGTAVGANKAAIFAGDGYIDLPQGLRAGASNFTISFMVKMNSSTGQERPLVLDDVNDGYIGFSCNPGISNVIRVNVQTSSPTTSNVTDASVTTTNLNHVVLALEVGVEYRLYVNGVLSGTKALVNGLLPVNALNNVFGAARNYTLGINGLISVPKFWNVKFTQIQVTTLATAELAGINILA